MTQSMTKAARPPNRATSDDMHSRPAALRDAAVLGVAVGDNRAVFVTTMRAVEVPLVAAAPAPATTEVMVIGAAPDVEELELEDEEEELRAVEDTGAEDGTALDDTGATRALDEAGAEEAAIGATDAPLLDTSEAREEIALEEASVAFVALLT